MGERLPSHDPANADHIFKLLVASCWDNLILTLKKISRRVIACLKSICEELPSRTGEEED